MKVCVLINQIHEGGAERVACTLLNNFISNGVESHLITTKRYEQEYELSGEVKRHNLSDVLKLKNRLSKNFKMTKAIKKYCLKNNIDCLISFMAESNFRAILATKNTGINTIISIRNDPKEEYKSLIYKLFAKKLFKKANRIVFQTPDAMNYFNNKIQSKGVIIANPINDKFLKQDVDLSKKADGFVTSGRLVEQKNHKLLIDAFCLIKDKVRDDLVIFGEGPLRHELEQYIANKNLSNRVYLKGQCYNLETELQKYKTFVLSSDFEGMPNSLMEAMALGMICISTDCPCGGPRYLFDGNKYGSLCNVKDIEALSELMLQASLNNDAINERVKTRNRAKEFSTHNICDKWIEIVKDLTNK